MQEVTDINNDIFKSNLANASEIQIVTLSAKSSLALDIHIKNYITFLKQRPDLHLRDIAFMSTNGRAHFDHRVAICAKSTLDLCSNLENKNFEIGQCQDTKRNVGFLFTGQGCQYANMGLSLYNNFPEFGKYFTECNTIFEKRFSLSFLDVWKSRELLEKTVYCQPSIFCIQYCLTMLWWEMGVKPDYVLGHSTGEFAAAVCAGILSLEDAMSLVLERSSLIDTVECGGMLAIKTNESNCNSLIRQFAKMNPTLWIDIAAINSNEEVVVSCKPETVVLFSQFCSSMSVHTKKIKATHAFHSRQMDTILDNYKVKATMLKHCPPTCAFISSVFAKEMDGHDFDSEYWVTHLRQTVRFSEAVEIMTQTCNILIEIGPHPVLLRFAMSGSKSSPGILFCPSLRRNQEDIECFAQTLSKLYVAGIKINWGAWVGDVNRRRPIQLPFYPFQRKKYWVEVPDPQSHNTFGQLNIGKKVAHPLLGFQIPSAHIGTTFQNFIDIHSLDYLADHKIVDTVIMPGMGFLEIIMAAGKQVLMTTDTASFIPLAVKNFSISTAMKLDGEKKNNLIEVIVRSVRDGEKEIKIYHLETDEEGGSESWREHAVGVVYLCPKIDFPGTDVHSLTSRMTSHQNIDEVYRKLFDRGYNFGPRFRNMSSFWSSALEAVSEIYAPVGIDPYICHPGVLDAMLQTAAIHFVLDAHNTSDKIMIPIGLKKYVWTGLKLTEKMFCHFCKETAKISLYSESGQLLACFHYVEWISTTVSAFLEKLDSFLLQLPTFYTESWRLIPPLKSIDTAQLITALKVSTETKKFILNFSGQESLIKSAKIIDTISAVYIMKAIQECGWLWSVGQACSNVVQDWNSRFPNELRSLKLIPSFINILSKEGYFDNNSIVFKPLPSIAECDELIKDITYTMSTLDDSADHVTFDLVRHCGTHLTSVLKNQLSGISVLFPEDKTKPSLNDHYKKAEFMKNHADMLSAMFADTVMPLVNDRSENCLRVLEIGAGTGSASIRIHQRLSELKITNTYTYTDISQFFLQEASKNFDSKFDYKVLNIEDDPLEQGFEPNHYDIIVGFLVVHATKSLTKTLENLRMLLKPGGVLILGESFVTPYSSTITFGLLDGWWIFDDFRELSPSVNSDVWRNVLLQSGYQDLQTASIIGDHCGCLIARIGHEPYRHLTMKTKVWFIVTDESELQRLLVDYLEGLNRLVITVKLSDFGTQIRHSSTSYTINAETPSGVLALFEEFVNLDIEGVLFMCTVPSMQSNLDIQIIQKRLCGGILCITQAMFKHFDSKNRKSGFVLLTRGVHYVKGVDSVAGDPNMGAAWGLSKVFGVENNTFKTRLIDLDQNFSPVNCGDILDQFWTRSQDKYFAIRNGNLFLQKIVEMPENAQPLKLPNTNRFAFHCEGTSIDDCVIRSAAVHKLKSDEVEVRAHSLALNFRDLFVILKPEGFRIPEEFSMIGLEVSGIVSAVGSQVSKFKVGDNVVGFNSSVGFSSHAVVKPNLLIHKPKHLSFSQAVALPIVVATAYVGLIKIAKLTKSDNVLIHAAAGGVGLAAIQIVKQVGAKIFATAGSHRKREFLRSIGIKHIYNSRNIDYKKQIEGDTDGVGIHVVLNSLTSDGFKEATLAICTQNARFVEISKVNIWTTAEVLSLRPDVSYTVFYLDAKTLTDGGTFDEVWSVIHSFPEDWYASLPITTFTFGDIKDALKYMMEAKHIGKIVLTMPTSDFSLHSTAIRYNYYDQNSSYLITGGLGGIGLEVLRWMVSVGARYIILASRNPQDGRGGEIINFLNHTYDAQILIVQANVGIMSDCVNLLAEIKSAGYPPLRGIMHAAGCLADGTIPNQSWEKFTQVFRAKVYGAWYLHTLTLNYGLEHFIMFSSATCIIGTRGQSNHSAANYYLDSLANYRHSLGLAASSINWGGWSEVGAMAAQSGGPSDISVCVKLFSPRKGIAALAKFVRNKYIHSCIADIDVKAVRAYLKSGSLFDELKVEAETESKFECTLSELEEKLIEELKNENREVNSPTLKRFVEASLKKVLRIQNPDVISQDQNFGTLGLDSLMSMEFRNILQNILGGKSLPMSTIQENPTIRTLSTQLEKIMRNDLQQTKNSNLGAALLSDLDILLRLDSKLPDDILAAEYGPIPASKAENIFLTGATGLLGGYILNQLSQRNVKIYCLIRAESQKVGKERLIQSLTKLQLLDTTDMTNIHIVAGDTTFKRFGLGCEEYSDLTTKIDLVVHVAAKVNHIEDYFQNNNFDLRKQNVFGTVNILRFACTHKTKLVLYASSIVVISKMTEDGILSEDYPDDEDYGKNLLVCDERVGYSLSKLICEKLIAQAEKRGIPVIAIRYPLIFGDSKSGFTVHENDHFWSMILTFLATKKVANLISEYPLIPVDIAARVSLEIMFNDKAETGVYNLTTDSVLRYEDLPEIINKVGIKGVTLTSSAEWYKTLFNLSNDSNPLARFESLYKIDGQDDVKCRYGDAKVRGKVKWDHLSSKVIRSFPEVKDIMVPSNIVLERHFAYHIQHQM